MHDYSINHYKNHQNSCFRFSDHLPLFLHNTMVTPFGGHFVTEISLGKITRH